VNTGAREVLAVPSSYKTPTRLLIYWRRVGHHYTQANTNNIDKTFGALLQATGLKAEPNIVFMWKDRKGVNRRGTDNTMAKEQENKGTNNDLLNTTQKTKDWATRTPQKPVYPRIVVSVS